MYIRLVLHIFSYFILFSYGYSSVNLFTFGSFFLALAARIRVKCVSKATAQVWD